MADLEKRIAQGRGDAPADYAACLAEFIAATGHLRAVPS